MGHHSRNNSECDIVGVRTDTSVQEKKDLHMALSFQCGRKRDRNPKATGYEDLHQQWAQHCDEEWRIAAWIPHKHIYNIRGTRQENKDAFLQPKIFAGSVSRTRISHEQREFKRRLRCIFGWEERRGLFVTSGSNWYVASPFVHRFEPQSLHDVASRSGWERFFGMTSLFCVNAFAYLSEMSQIVGIWCNHGHVRIHTRRAKSTTLHHPSMHSDNYTDPKHNKSRPFRTHLDQSRNCLYRIFCVSVDALCWFFVGQRGSGLWQLLVVAGLGDSGERRVVGQVAGAIAKDRGWPSSSVRQRVAASKRGDPAPRYVGGVEWRLTPELLDEIRVFIDEECGWNSVNIVSNRFTLSTGSPLCAPASVGDPYCAPSWGPSHPWSSQVRRRDAGEVGASIGETHRAEDFIESTPESGRVLRQRWEKSSKFARLLQVTGFNTFSRWKQGRFHNYDHAKTESSIVTSAHFWSHFAWHLSLRSGPPLYGHSSPRGCVAGSAIQGASAWSSCLLSALASRDKLNLTRHRLIHGSSTSIMLCLNMQRRNNRTRFFWRGGIFFMKGHISTTFQIKSQFLCPTYPLDLGFFFSKVA